VTSPVRSLPDVQPPAPPPDREVSFPAAFIAVVAVSAAVIILCVLGVTMSGMFNFATGTGQPATQVSVANPELAARAPATTFSDGQWMVSGDIQPGTYATTVPAGSPGCTWERNASTDGTAASVLESGNGKEGEALVVNIKDTDRIFQARGCGDWQRTGD
jgi:hypothetical protein